jgi:hypothetical protein
VPVNRLTWRRSRSSALRISLGIRMSIFPFMARLNIR